ncbi:hypothetical protein KC19_2G133500 [Ceratodon purpureus]|uniref:Uncharacterized protein n=1 Tax=Ceratodon purpureus TaxID=3225 RepID=A0A8T0ITE4_CERPU|nr:hypothetical protein KC19_2G133500 [Ceratodon purpureus]
MSLSSLIQVPGGTTQQAEPVRYTIDRSISPSSVSNRHRKCTTKLHLQILRRFLKTTHSVPENNPIQCTPANLITQTLNPRRSSLSLLHTHTHTHTPSQNPKDSKLLELDRLFVSHCFFAKVNE